MLPAPTARAPERPTPAKKRNIIKTTILGATLDMRMKDHEEYHGTPVNYTAAIELR
jgi:hypothetical protein